MEDRLEPLDPGGVTDFVGDDVLIEVLDGHAAMVPRSLKRLPAESKLLMAEGIKRVQAIYELQNELESLIADMRDANVSWAAIGWVLGTTGEAARQRFGDA